MKTIALRPPLPAPLSHNGIQFFLDERACGNTTNPLSERVIAAIASCLQTVLPPDKDLFVDTNGSISAAPASSRVSQSLSLWYYAGLLDGVERNIR